MQRILFFSPLDMCFQGFVVMLAKNPFSYQHLRHFREAGTPPVRAR